MISTGKSKKKLLYLIALLLLFSLVGSVVAQNQDVKRYREDFNITAYTKEGAPIIVYASIVWHFEHQSSPRCGSEQYESSFVLLISKAYLSQEFAKFPLEQILYTDGLREEFEKNVKRNVSADLENCSIVLDDFYITGIWLRIKGVENPKLAWPEQTEPCHCFLGPEISVTLFIAIAAMFVAIVLNKKKGDPKK